MVVDKASIQVELSYNRIVNYAMQQNHFPIVRELLIRNTTEQDIHDVIVSIVDSMELGINWSKHLDLLPANTAVNLSVIDVKIPAKLLGELTERLNGDISITVAQEDNAILEQVFPLDILAFDEWGGLAVAPEMITAFVTPNHPEIIRLTRVAGDILSGWLKDAAFDGYQSHNASRTRQQVAAIYQAILQENIMYSVLPPSYEQHGQRIRLADTLVSNRLGNCLDLTVLIAGCLEAVGLNPLIVFKQGHAFVGAWLIDETFPEVIQDDLSLLSKRTADGLHEICLVESTSLTSGIHASFEDAERAGRAHLMDEDKFILFVDVKRARSASIRPLPLRIKTDVGWEYKHPVPEKVSSSQVPSPLFIVDTDTPDGSSTHPKVKEWERRLLDLSLRNTLLNFRSTRTSIPILSYGLPQLEDGLASATEYQLLPAPSDWGKSTHNSELFAHFDNGHPLEGVLTDELKHNRLRAALEEVDLKTRSTNLWRAAKTSLEESGANTLYLALGFLKWYESESSQKARYAPLILIPVELVRKNSRVGFGVRRREDDAQFNITLVEMLKQNFSIEMNGVDPLPTDDFGIDLRKVYTLIRKLIKDKPRWDVVEQAYLGLFSFGQFVMWNDLHRRKEDLKKNKVVSSLMAAKLEWQPIGTLFDTTNLDDKYEPHELLSPLSSDSSQLRAISAALEGESFVLHGPPGTGKSQTITNIIANMLRKGKTVLFVAEKMAALSVVQRRLADIGLDAFALEIHSNKGNKREVLDQLNRALEASKGNTPDNWKSTGAQLSETRTKLNRFVAALHTKHHNGLSVHNAIALFDSVRNAPDIVFMEPSKLAQLSYDDIEQLIQIVSELRIGGQVCGGPHLHPLADIHCEEFSATLRSQADTSLRGLIQELKKTRHAVRNLVEMLSLSETPSFTRRQLSALPHLCKLLLELPDVTSSFFETDLAEMSAVIHQTVAHGTSRDTLRTTLFADYSAELLTFDAKHCLTQWIQAGQEWFIPRQLHRARILKQIKPLWLPGHKVTTDRVETDLSKILELQREEAAIQAVASTVSSWVSPTLWNQGNPSWRELTSIVEWRQHFDQTMSQIFDNPQQHHEFVHALARALATGAEPFRTRFNSSLTAVADACQSLQASESSVGNVLHINFEENSTVDGSRPNWLEEINQMAEQWLGNLSLLRDWCTWRSVRAKALKHNLESIVLAWENGQLNEETVLPTFQKSLYKGLAEQMMMADDDLNKFSSPLFEDSIRRFRNLTDEYEGLSQQEIAAQVASRVPTVANISPNTHSEMGILLRAIRSGARGMSLRNLFSQIPNLLTKVCPCFLMSPLSVAQYLDLAMPMFDLVIFDEASQLPTAEAIGAMARGKNVIVVGDPKQLPPTQFFASGSRDSDETEATEDLESVLEDCLALGMPQGHLLWHYRSRSEALIAFSNHHYYENKLLTFPSADELKRRVHFHKVDGIYDRGRTKQNHIEAQAVVNEIKRRLSNPELRKQSIGVVTFNLQQKNLIEDLLDEAFQTDHELESASSQMYESLFIKNLENVQGDERDVILFSIGYGPNAKGKVNLNFGPLNRNGGWRRLNVAVSRARQEMVVFSTLRADQIDTSKTTAEGVAGLKAFLAYAEKGVAALSIQPPSIESGTAPRFEHEIARRLRDLGYTVAERVGSSEFRVDLGIVDNRDNGRFLLGIITDGDAYRKAATARDRDVLRARVLEQLGWNLHSVWAMDWWENPDREIERIIQAIHKAEQHASAEPPMQDSVCEEKVANLVKNDVHPSSDGTPSNTVTPVEYESAVLSAVALPSEAFYDYANNRLIMEQLLQVIKTEGPISRSLAYRRVLEAWGIKRMGNRIEERFDHLVDQLDVTKTTQSGQVFFWPNDSDPRFYRTFRTEAGSAEKRNAHDLPIEEVTAAVKYVLASQISLPKPELIREVSRVMGYQRTGTTLERIISRAIDVAIAHGFAAFDHQRQRVITACEV